MTDKHTPGPWFTRRQGYSVIYIESRIRPGILQEVAACGPTEAGHEQQEANATLVAAAPELLDALRHLVHNVRASGTRPDLGWLALAAADAAIARATGEKA